MPAKPGHFMRQDTAAASDFYREQGFLVIQDAFPEALRRELLREALAICSGERGALGGWGGGPAPEVACAGLSEDERLGRFLCIHQPHKCSPLIQRALGHESIVEVLTKIIGPNVKCMQSMFFIKAAGKPGQAWHQDEDYIPTRDRSLTGAWIALDDAVVENGCLWVLPGSQRHGVLWPMYPHRDPRYDCSAMSFDFPYREDEAVPVEVPAGAIVFFNGYLLHKSEPNVRKSGFRRALVNHYMSAESLLPWRVQEGLGTAKMDYRDIVMIAGRDPYAYKGLEDLARPHVRASGEGGCGDGRVDAATFKQMRGTDRKLVHR